VRFDVRDGARLPRLGSVETAPAALREKLVPVPGTPGRQLQLDFQRRAPERCTDHSGWARASSALHGARLTSATGSSVRLGVVFRTSALLPLTSDVPSPLPRRRVNDAGFNARPRHLRSLNAAAWPQPTLAGHGLPTRTRRQPQPATRSNEHDDIHRPLQSTQSPSTLARTIATRRHAAFHGVASHLAALRRCETHRPPWIEVSAVQGTEAGSNRDGHPGHQRWPRHTGAW
jgi:hypothetical protein